MAYMRIATGKFWAWVVVSLLVGLGIGLAIMFVRTGSLTSRITVLERQVTSAGEDASAAVAAQTGQIAALEASVTALTDQNAQLTADLEAAKDNSSSSSSDTSTSDTTTPTIAVTSRSVSPSSPEASATITLKVKVTGAPTKVTLRLYNSSKSYDKTFTLHKASSSGGTQTWTATTKAPPTAGTYHYYATAIKGSERVTMKGASPATLKVQ